MPLEEAMVFVLARAGCGMTVQRLTDIINRERLHIRADGQPVTEAQVYATICHHRAVFIKENGRILLSM